MEAESGVFRSYARRIVAHAPWVICGLLAFTVFLITRVGNLQIDMDPDLWAPQAHPYIQTTNQLERIFGGRNFTLIGIVPRDGDVYQPRVLAKIQRIQQGIEALPQAVRHNVLSVAARKVKSISGSTDGMQVRQLMETVPQTPAEMAALKAALASLPIYINSLVSADGKAAAVVADFKVDKSNPNYTAIVQAIRPIIERERDSSVDIYLGGQPVSIAWFEFHLMKMPLFFGIALLLVMIIQYWSFRSLQGMLLPMLTAILSVIWGLGLMGLFGVHMDPMNTTTPILVMAVAAGHGIQILKRYYEEYQRLREQQIPPREANRGAVVESLVRIGPIMLTAGLIAVITFYSLAATGIEMVKHFGVFAGSGVLGAMVLELTLIPALRALLPAPKASETDSERRTGVLDRFLQAVARNLVGGRAPWVVGTGLALLAIAAYGLTFLRVDNRLKDYHRPSSEFRIHDDILNQRFGGTNSILFLVETATPDGIKDPKVLQGIAALQGFLDRQPFVGKTQSIVDLLKRMNQAMHADQPDAYTVPPRRDLVAQYLFLYSLSGDPQDFDSFIDNDYQKAVIWTYLKSDSSAYADGLYRKAQAVIARSFPPGVTVRMGGSLPQNMATNEVVTRDKFRNMAQMVAIVFVLSALVLRSAVGGLFVVTPVLAVILANFGLMGWIGMPLDIGAATAAAMAVGIGADYEIYLLFRFREELARSGDILAATRESLRTSGKAIVFVALSIIGGYAVLQFSGFGWYNQISTLVMATMTISAGFALFFLRALMMMFKPRFIFGTHAAVVLLVLALGGSPVGHAATTAELSARDIMEKNFFVSKVKSLNTQATMLLINERGQTRERKNTTLSKLQPNGIDSKLLVKFTTPADIKGTAFLQVQHADADDDEWIYLPALAKSRRLVANNKKDSFVGSDFSYGDISLPQVDLYQHTLLRSQTIDGQDCYVIESIPKNETTKADSGYSKKITWVRTDNFFEAQVEYYDLSGRQLKTQRISNFKLLEPDQQRWTALHREMVNLQTGHKTIFNFDQVKADVPLTDDLFTTRYLERE